MSKPPEDYNKLKAFWYKKLKKEGFDDIEDDEGRLKSWAVKFNNRRFQQLWQSRETYYYLATQFLNDYKFENRMEKFIWEQHVNAASVRDITTALKKARIAKSNRQTVWLVIKRLEQHMKDMYLSGYKETQD